VAPRLQREVLDAGVELSFQTRTYHGRRSSNSFVCRPVAVWNEPTKKYHVDLTNIGPERLSAEEVAQLYSVRWQVETFQPHPTKLSYGSAGVPVSSCSPEPLLADGGALPA